MNGLLEKCDGNFFGNFDVKSVDNILFGAFPITDSDIKVLVKNAVTTVVNLQTDLEMRELGIDWNKMV